MVERQPLDVLEAMHSTRSIRFLKPDPIPDEVIWAILDAAIRGPNGSNTQRWGWIVVRDPEVRLKLAEWYRDGWNLANRVEKRSREDRFEIARTNPLGYQGYLGVEYLAENLEHAPVHIIPVTIGRDPACAQAPRSTAPYRTCSSPRARSAWAAPSRRHTRSRTTQRTCRRCSGCPKTPSTCA